MSLSVVWFRQDLRLGDNPALVSAVKAGTVLPVYILDDVNSGEFQMGGASRVWLHHSLSALNMSLDGNLNVYFGDAREIISEIVTRMDAERVFWNRCFEPWRVSRDEDIELSLRGLRVDVGIFNGSLLWRPEDVLKSDGTPYKVFTPFYRRGCLGAGAPREPLATPYEIDSLRDAAAMGIDELGLLPEIRWDEGLASHWEIGELSAIHQLDSFLDSGLEGYKDGRNFPAKSNVSRLSAHLHFGEISVNQLWYSAQESGGGVDLDCFLSELGWREFSHSLLTHFPELPQDNLQKKFDRFPWRHDARLLRAWQTGQTGIPIVDAGMRELWQTGYIHNRVRMIVGSFLVKNLRIDWREGERWFWDTLVDADLANNSAGWQWIAGCGADAAPYFRVFNPVSQGEKFDVDGAYTLRFVPELRGIDRKYLFRPWEAPESVLDYPEPIVDLKQSRLDALEAFSSLKLS